ncbi:MAG: hypothetical protein Q7P63_01110 [Verrucomicrobiota bacterium JB022]|nr:hypothetical protein [Verrucomicrobiota bacterium JB022]
MTENTNTDGHDMAILTEGRKTLTVIDRQGQEHEVTVHKVGLQHMHKLLEASGDDYALAQTYLDPREPRPGAWLKQLTDESLMDILEEGGEINDPLFDRWWTRQQKRMKALGVDPQKFIEEGMARAMDAQLAKAKASA